jgi:oligogalacturonide lyase
MLIGMLVLAGAAIQAPPKEWIDPDTGHKVLRLTDEPGSASLYFHQNPFTSDGRRMVYTSPQGIHVLDLATRASRLVVAGRVRLIVAGRKTNSVFYTQGGSAWVADLDGGQSRELAKLPPRASVATVNADETLLAGTYIEGEAGSPQPVSPQTQNLLQAPNKGEMMERRWAARLPMAMFVTDTRTGKTTVIHRSNDWLNHLQFSPTDPGLIMFCHEGPWHKVDRIWTIRADGSALTKIHTRTMQMEIFGHEFFDPDGKTIWYDLQTPRGELFWLAGYNLETKRRVWYHLERDEWSVHFNTVPGGQLFAGDGGDPGQVAHAKNGQWIYLFRPQRMENRGVDDPGFVQPGTLRPERLVNMSKHNYRLEPNVLFTPDRKYVVFRSNMFGESYVFAVEIAKDAH